MNQDLNQYWQEKKALVNEAIDKFLPKGQGLDARLIQAMSYSVKAGGKRLRPMLVLSSYEMVGGHDLENALPTAVAVEFIHTFSLIHDDLPAIDDDDIRRGLPSCHKAFGEAMAVLAGDGLLVEAFDLMTRGPAPVERKMAVIKEITRAIGLEGVLSGEAVDVLAEKERWPVERELVEFIHTKKTAALIAGCVASGAILAGADGQTVDAIRQVGRKMGLAFQIVDDLLDVVGDQDKVGKQLGKDQDKATWVKLRGVKASKQDASQLVSQAIEELQERFGQSAWPLVEIARFITERDM